MTTRRWVLVAAAALVLWPAPAAAQDKKKVAFLVGVGKYKHEFPDLGGVPENDVAEMGKVLAAGGFKVARYENEKATKKTIEAAFADTLKNPEALARGDVLLVVLCGHGVTDFATDAKGVKRETSFFCGHDARPNAPDTMVDLAGLITAAKPFGCTALFLVDACRNIQDVDRGDGLHAQNLQLPVGVSVFFSCKRGQKAVQSAALKHGLFTHVVLRTLRGETAPPLPPGPVGWPDLVAGVYREFNSADFRKKHLRPEQPQDPVEMNLQVGYVELLTLNKRMDAPPPPPPPDLVKEDLVRYTRALNTGRGTKPFFEEAGPRRIGLWKEEAEKGNPVAMVFYGRCLYLGTGVAQDPAAAVALYRRASDAGHPLGHLNLGAVYQEGKAVAKDEAVARDLFLKAADGNLPSGIDAVATQAMLDQRYAESHRLFQKGVDAGFPPSMFGLGLLYENGQGVPKDEAEAARWYAKGAAAGYPSAMLKLGMAYANGRGVAASDGRAVQLYRAVLDAGDHRGASMLGYMHERGRGVPQDAAKAAGYYEVAANKGVPAAMYNLGVLFENGSGVRQSRDDAIFWYRKGAAAGDGDAKKGLARLGG